MDEVAELRSVCLVLIVGRLRDRHSLGGLLRIARSVRLKSRLRHPLQDCIRLRVQQVPTYAHHSGSEEHLHRFRKSSAFIILRSVQLPAKQA